MPCHVEGCPAPVQYRLYVQRTGEEEITSLEACSEHLEAAKRRLKPVAEALGPSYRIFTEPIEPGESEGE